MYKRERVLCGIRTVISNNGTLFENTIGNTRYNYLDVSYALDPI